VATRFIGVEKQIADAAQRINMLMPNDDNGASRHIMILVNVVSRAQELRAEGRPVKEIPEIAAQFGKRIAFYAQDERLLDLQQKATNAATLFLNNRQLALEACEAFILVRIEHRKLRGLGDEQDFGASYEDAVQRITRAIESPKVSVAPRK
jgi:hypothetical protein